MAGAYKVTRRENYRVEVRTRDFPGSKYAEEFEREALERIKEQIERHVDGVTDVRIECDTVEVCSECGRTWEPTRDPEADGLMCAGCGAVVGVDGRGER